LILSTVRKTQFGYPRHHIGFAFASMLPLSDYCLEVPKGKNGKAARRGAYAV